MFFPIQRSRVARYVKLSLFDLFITLSWEITFSFRRGHGLFPGYNQARFCIFIAYIYRKNKT